MNPSQYEKGLEEAVHQLHNAIQANSNALGAAVIDDNDEIQVIPNQLLGDWVLMCNFTDPETGCTFVCRVNSAHLLETARDGLLFRGLYKMEGE